MRERDKYAQYVVVHYIENTIYTYIRNNRISTDLEEGRGDVLRGAQGAVDQDRRVYGYKVYEESF